MQSVTSATPQAGCWCSRLERRPYVRLIVLGNGPRHASGLRTSDTGQTAGDLSPGNDPLTLTCSCEACSAFTRVAARTLAPSPIRDLLHRRLQPFRHLYDCSGCFRLERSPGGTCTHWKAPPFTAHTRSRRRVGFGLRFIRQHCCLSSPLTKSC